MKKKVTFQDIADELGVSKGLVSIAINNKYGVSEAMRSKIVLKAIEMGYVFKNETKKSKTISLLIKNIGVLNEEFWRQCIFGIEGECAKKNIVFNIINWANINSVDDIMFKIFEEKNDGLIVLNQCKDSIAEKIGKLDVPIVCVDMINQFVSSADNVMANNFRAGEQAINYLLGKGHKKIVMIGNTEYSFSFLQRYFGCSKAIKIASKLDNEVESYAILDCEDNHLVDGIYQNDDSDLCNVSSLKEFLTNNDKYTAIVCFSDAILRQTIKIIPKNLSIVSIDNTSFSVEHDITSVDIPKIELGVLAVRTLIDRIENSRTTSLNMELNTKIIERNSVKEINV